VPDDDEPHPSSENDRRSTVRQPIELKVEYKRLNTFFADYTKNISRGGTFIKTVKPLPIGTEFVFRLLIPDLERHVSIHGEVARIVDVEAARMSGGEPGMAIRFIYKTGDSQSEIAALVEQLMGDSLGQRLSGKLLSHLRGRGDK
jgi:type IV pilus assembly protein PilZ